MSLDVVQVAIIFLIVTNALTLLGVVQIARRMRPPPTRKIQPAGRRLPHMTAQFGHQRLELGRTNHAMALVFASSGCSDCEQALARLLPLVNSNRNEGLEIYLCPVEPDGHPSLALDPVLEARRLILSFRDVRTINPVLLVPSYLFVDERGIVRASGVVGDEDWISFEHQITA